MMVSMYPEDSSRALKVYQEHQQVGRVAHQVPTFEIEGTIISRLQSALGVAASMKRGGAEVALVHLEWVRRTHQWGSSRRCQALSQGGRALPCFVKGDVLRRQAVLVLAMQSLPLGAAHAATLPRASLRPAACGPDGVRRGGVWPA